MKTIKLAYILKRFPRFSETFILNELLAIQAMGIEVVVFSLLHPGDESQHEMLREFSGKIYWMPRSIASKFLPQVAWRPDDTGTISGLPFAQRDATPDELLPNGTGLVAEILPGKSAHDASHLVYQASQIALLASSAGVSHLHAHFASNATAVAALASRLSGIPFSFTAHARDIYHRYIDRVTDEQLLCRKMAEAQFCVTVSDYNQAHLKSLLEKHGYRRRDHVFRLYNGIDLVRFKSDTISRDKLQILAVGRLVEKKGFRYLIEACARLQGQRTDFRCDIVGDGPEREMLEGLVKKHELEHQVHLTGALPQEQLQKKIRQASFVTLPCVIAQSGDRDGLPTVLLEAMAIGRACISTRVAGVPEIIDHGNTGLLVDAENPESLADAMQRLLEQPELAKSMGIQARMRAEVLFSLQNNVQALVQLMTNQSEQTKAGVMQS